MNSGKISIDCPQCGQRFSADLPAPQITNSKQYSTVIAIHPSRVVCPNSSCKLEFILMINEVRVGWIAAPQERESLLTIPLLKVAGHG